MKQSYILAALTALFGLGAASCFTGVESTPKIDSGTLKKEQVRTTPEQIFLSEISPKPPRLWQEGRRLRVADKRISRIFNAPADSLPGTDIIFKNFSPARSLTGDNATDAIFTDYTGRTLTYRINGIDAARLDTMHTLVIPFTIDLDIVADIDKALRGNTYYIKTPSWYSDLEGRKSIKGLRQIAVTIDSVVPGDDYFPAAVCFTASDTINIPEGWPRTGMVLMSIGNSRAASRNFDTLFAFDNPRKLYPYIKDDAWDLIICSRVQEGMTREECRLALGAPSEVLRTPSYAGMREQWTYSDGVYLFLTMVI